MRALRSLLPLCVLAKEGRTPTCKAYCSNPCGELNGNVVIECGLCPLSVRCNRAAPDFIYASKPIAAADDEQRMHAPNGVHHEGAADRSAETILFRRNRSQFQRSPTVQFQWSPTAVCLAGEARTIVSPRVRSAQMRHLVEPLGADLFLVLSPPSHREVNREAWLSHLRHIEQQMDPVSLVVARDDQMIDVLSRLIDQPTAERQRVLDCARSQPLPSHRMDRGGPDWRAYFQLGPCCPQLSLALRHRVCLSLLERAERERHVRYTWVVRARPDIAFPCELSAAVIFRPGMVRYYMDFAAFMPRRAADATLREVPLAREWNVTGCYNYPTENQMGNCNGEVVRRAGWKTVSVEARVWVPEERRFLEQDVGYPARRQEVPRNKQRTMRLPVEPDANLHGEDEPDNVALPPYPPFGNGSSQSNPLVPNGALYPRCSLAQNATAATAQQMRTRMAVPYLLEPGMPSNAAPLQF